jgi:high affinity Mn2+ porin
MVHELILSHVRGLGAFRAIALASALLASPATAADLPVKAPRAVAIIYDWTGFYVGGHFGYGSGSFGAGTIALKDQGVVLPASIAGLIGGFQGGYRYQFGNHVVLGAEGEVTFPSPVDQQARRPAPFHNVFDVFGSARITAGYAIGAWLPYATAGLAWGRTHVNVNDVDGLTVITQRPHVHVGWTAGAGVEVAIDGPWSARLQYDYVDLETRNFNVETAPGGSLNVTPHYHEVTLGLNYKLFMPVADGNSIDELKQPSSGNWNVHAQTTFLEQAYPSFRAPYVGQNSLPGKGQGRETWTVTAFLGWRVWEGGEIYFNPELGQGFGLNSALGLGGFSNGEAQKSGTTFPRVRAQRYFFRQTFGLGGEQEDVADGPNQLAGKRDIDRITLSVGRVAIGDFFDQNAYAHDPRADFMNWAMWEAAAYDFPADLPGFTRGAVLEFNRKDWAVRTGAFQVPTGPNSDVLSFKTGGTIVEFEERHSIFDQPGKIRIGAFANRGNMADYRGVLATVAAIPALDIGTATTLLRGENTKYGFYGNLEQQIINDVGFFARASWNDGRAEILSFTDIDRSVSGGFSIKGSFWGRSDDTVGIGAAVNGLSRAHRDFLAAGGTGLLIGDGQLNYRTEDILEAYYAWMIQKGLVATFDYQFINNPAYNADRGPVSIFSARVHAEW